MNIDRLGEALIDQLADAGLVKTFADLYGLKREDIETLERMGEKSAQNVIAGNRGQPGPGAGPAAGGAGHSARGQSRGVCAGDAFRGRWRRWSKPATKRCRR